MKLVYTNDNCIGCNKCISSCPVLNANKAIIVDGKPKIEVNEEQCIACDHLQYGEQYAIIYLIKV